MVHKVISACALAATCAVLPATAVAAAPAGDYVATIAVSSQQYRIRLVEAADIKGAQALLAGQSTADIPNGKITRGTADVNTGYHWHIDPADFAWAQTTTEVCDGVPSDVESGLLNDRFCPWQAQLLSLTPVG